MDSQRSSTCSVMTRTFGSFFSFFQLWEFALTGSRLFWMCDLSLPSYVPFDFHEVCKGSKFENLKVLISEVADEISCSMFYWRGPNGVEFVRQPEIFRVNCMDCLDRTNVVQSMIARQVVNTQLMKHGLQGSPDQSQDQKFDLTFNSSNTFSLLFFFSPFLRIQFSLTQTTTCSLD